MLVIFLDLLTPTPWQVTPKAKSVTRGRCREKPEQPPTTYG